MSLNRENHIPAPTGTFSGGLHDMLTKQNRIEEHATLYIAKSFLGAIIACYCGRWVFFHIIGRDFRRAVVTARFRMEK